jgi:hypothetical protein
MPNDFNLKSIENVWVNQLRGHEQCKRDLKSEFPRRVLSPIEENYRYISARDL